MDRWSDGIAWQLLRKNFIKALVALKARPRLPICILRWKLQESCDRAGWQHPLENVFFTFFFR